MDEVRTMSKVEIYQPATLVLRGHELKALREHGARFAVKYPHIEMKPFDVISRHVVSHVDIAITRARITSKSQSRG